jgi:ribosome biogenesis GTPase
MRTGRIIKGVGGLYTVMDDTGGVYVLRCKGKFRKLRMTPLVGDRVAFTPGRGEAHGWLEEIEPRSTVCSRPPVANAEILAVMVAPLPKPDMLMADKLFLAALRQGMTPVMVFNKVDLDDGYYEELTRDYQDTGIAMYPVCALTGRGIPQLREALKGRVTCLAGQSGVGKSTFINRALGADRITGDISDRIHRGRHTTRHVELIEKDGFSILDTPGFSLLETEEIDPAELQHDYREFVPYIGSCKFSVCYHDGEPGCAVSRAAQAGHIAAGRLERYRIILAQVKAKRRDQNG